MPIVKAATGSSKTYNALKVVMQIVCEESQIAILAFPTLKFLIQTHKLIKNLLIEEEVKEKIKPNNSELNLGPFLIIDIDIYLITLASDTKYSTLNKLFQEGLGWLLKRLRRPRIFLTVHLYFKLRGDAPKVTALISQYRDSIWLAINEVHNFVNSCIWKIPYESMVITKTESNFEDTSSITSEASSFIDQKHNRILKTHLSTKVLFSFN